MLTLSFSQTSLDSIVTREIKCPTFTNAGLMDYIIELIIREDEVCNTSTECLSDLDKVGVFRITSATPVDVSPYP
jgi:hypothetical protein